MKIKTLDAIDPDASGKSKKTFVGTLSAVEGDDILMTLKKDAVAIRIALQQIDKANLKFEF